MEEDANLKKWHLVFSGSVQCGLVFLTAFSRSTGGESDGAFPLVGIPGGGLPYSPRHLTEDAGQALWSGRTPVPATPLTP